MGPNWPRWVTAEFLRRRIRAPTGQPSAERRGVASPVRQTGRNCWWRAAGFTLRPISERPGRRCRREHGSSPHLRMELNWSRLISITTDFRWVASALPRIRAPHGRRPARLFIPGPVGRASLLRQTERNWWRRSDTPHFQQGRVPSTFHRMGEALGSPAVRRLRIGLRLRVRRME